MGAAVYQPRPLWPLLEFRYSRKNPLEFQFGLLNHVWQAFDFLTRISHSAGRLTPAAFRPGVDEFRLRQFWQDQFGWILR